jgi:hypothetical protein
MLLLLLTLVWGAPMTGAQDVVAAPPPPAPATPVPPPPVASSPPPTVLVYQEVPPPPAPAPVAVVAPAPADGAPYEEVEEESVWSDRPVVIEAQVSPIGGPYGIAGGAIDVSLASWLSINAGLGAGGVGLQYGGSVRPRIPLGRMFAIGMTVGISRGPYEEFDFHSGATTDQATWLNFGPAFEIRPSFGFSIRINPGLSQLLYAEDPSGSFHSEFIPFITIAPGFAP